MLCISGELNLRWRERNGPPTAGHHMSKGAEIEFFMEMGMETRIRNIYMLRPIA
jgi:hypothetical protein